mgnify:CR=1 FL=1
MADMNKPLLEVKNLKTFFKTRNGIVKAVNDVSYSIYPGKTLGIVGESGSGKSTIGRSVIRLYDPTAGKITFDGQDISGKLSHSQNNTLRTQMQMIFQDPMTSLNPYLTIGEQVAEPLVIHEGAGKKEARVRALEQLALAGIPDAEQRMDAYPPQFSGGMRQRVMIAMALITRPEILIADEPTTALDVTVQKQVLDLIRKLQQDMGTSVILITHDLGVVRQYADRINVMYAGRIVESAPAKELLEHPRHAYTRALMKSIPGLHAKGAPLYTIPGLPPNMTQEPCGCSFRPRNTLGNPALCLTDREPELVEISPGHSVQNCPGCLA